MKLDAHGNAGAIAAVMKANDAQVLADAGNYAGALALYEEALRLCPAIPYRGNLHNLYGTILFDIGELKQAQDAFATAIEEECVIRHEPYRWLGFSFAAEGRFDLAFGAMLQAAELGEQGAFAAQALATYRFADNDVDGALFFVQGDFAYEESEADPRIRVALIRAELLRLMGRNNEALRALDFAESIAESMPSDLALWLAGLDRSLGKDRLRHIVVDALSNHDDVCARVYTAIVQNQDVDAALETISDWSLMTRVEYRSMSYRVAGLFAEAEGNLAMARSRYECARLEPRSQWLIHYHMAGRALEAMTSTP